ncbi:MAG TPA: phytanoyl-CoA dioxygenase family protein [Caldilineaceae bacterium]|nr:phytanoyl-CoA dioxygenase family protein [Caldilineaceae bacterium]
MNIRFGYRPLAYPSANLAELRDSNALLGNRAALQQRMTDDGYLLLRGLIDRQKILHARATIMTHMAAHDALTPETPVLEGVMPKGGHSVPMMGRKGIAHHGDVLSVLESDELYTFFATYFGEPALTFHYKWLRAVGNEQYTGAHYDYVYMGQGSPNLHTVWIPFGDIPVEQGTLAMCVGSNRLPAFEKLKETYGRMDVDRDKTEGWFTKDPMEIVEKFGGQWATTDFRAGDVILFGMHTMHASTTNLTNRFRLSCDVRFQPASEPADKRWLGDEGTGHSALGKMTLRSMEEARAAWGV